MSYIVRMSWTSGNRNTKAVLTGGQPTRPTQPFRVDKWVVSCNQMAAITTHSSSALWWKATGKGRCGVFAVWKLCDPHLRASAASSLLWGTIQISVFYIYLYLWRARQRRQARWLLLCHLFVHVLFLKPPAHVVRQAQQVLAVRTLVLLVTLWDHTQTHRENG